MNTATSAALRLQVEAVSFGYEAGREVLDRVEMEVGRGEFVAMIGANGSGKSTVLRIAAALRRPWHGRVRWAGRDVSAWPAAERAREIAILPQSVQPVYRLRARQVVELGRHPHRTGAWSSLGRDDREAVEAALAVCDATELAERDFDDLSGGERQRVLLASALAQGGRLLLLDEPTAALDLAHQVAAFAQLRVLAREGRAVLVATHDLNLAATFADRLVLLARGRVHASGAPAEVLTAANVESALGVGLWVGEHPATGVPCVLPLPGTEGMRG